jgi:predicted permease
MIRDLRLAARMLLQSKAWTAVIVVSLALGIGANTALFSAIDGLLLAKLPVSDPDSLVRLRYAGRNQMATDSSSYGFTAPDARGREVVPTFSYPMYLQFLADNRTMSDVLACAPFGRVNVVVHGQAEIATGFLTSGNYYQLLGVKARLGRTLLSDDDRPTAAPAAVISHKYWTTRFGGAPDVVGTAAQVNSVAVTIVGVLAPEFTGEQQAVADAPDVSMPLALVPQLNRPAAPGDRAEAQLWLSQPTNWWLHVMGRLKPGVTAAQVQGNLGGVFQHTAKAGFDAYMSSLPAQERSRSYLRDRTQVPELIVDSGSRGVYDVETKDLRAVTVLSAVVLLVLLLVCANVANLLLSRATARQRELSVRLALGATRARLVRQLLTESLLLSAIGGAVGVVVGRWGQALLPGVTGRATPLDWRVLAFVIVVTTATGVIFGVAPALRATRTDVNATLKETSRSVAGGRSLLGKSLLVAQIAISLMLLVGAGLFLRTLQSLRQVDVGFNPKNVLLFRINPSLNRYDTAKQTLLFDRIGERLGSIASVRSVAWSNPALLAGSINSTNMFVQGRTYSPGQRDEIYRVVVSPAFFETMEIPLVAGRGFTARDTESAPFVGVINQAAARKFFPNGSAVGRRFGTALEDSGKIEVVGILRDAKYDSVRDAVVPTMYVPYRQAPRPTATFEVRTAGDPLAAIGSVRQAVRDIDPNLPLMNISTQLDEVEHRFLQEKVFAQAYTLFGGLALLVAAIGLFGLMSYSVSRRTNEIGIRMALGARGQDVRRLVMGESMTLVAAGIAAGLCGAVAAGRLVATMLYGLAPTDLLTMAGATTVMVAVSALAGYLPARRASLVDPMVALHYE